MIKEITEKIQGNGVKSWRIDTYEDSTKKVLLDSEMVYTDPTQTEPVDMSNVDLSTMTPEQLQALKTALGL